MIRRNKDKPYYCSVCGKPRGKDEVIKGSELVAKKLVRCVSACIDNRDRRADPLRCVECHQKVRIKVYPSWKSRSENYKKQAMMNQHIFQRLK